MISWSHIRTLHLRLPVLTRYNARLSLSQMNLKFSKSVHESIWITFRPHSEHCNGLTAKFFSRAVTFFPMNSYNLWVKKTVFLLFNSLIHSSRNTWAREGAVGAIGKRTMHSFSALLLLLFHTVVGAEVGAVAEQYRGKLPGASLSDTFVSQCSLRCY